ncbi:hypothetical protein [Dyadobacter psychrophilus]|uniref:Uncharacterized protein n=1 Tax=Dyadobacter psychrophilus TaxID=651661 RepID=A0A1T5BA12_9BACT|nr:hypothetical protein [Dyadobacter psychrophilus]SKB43907.1 hypothetical protein SAMN05660293_00169 [Dyadobacter psychrophilus]
MKKILAVGAVSGVVLYVFFNKFFRQMERNFGLEKKQDEIAGNNKTEGYFYHQSELATDNTAGELVKNINN